MLGYTAELVTAQVDGSALTNSTGNLTILPLQSRLFLPSNAIQFIGQELIIKASGRISTLVTTPGTIAFTFVLGASQIAVTPAFALNTVAKTDVTWWLEWALTARAVGASGNFMHTGFWASEAVVGSPLPAAGGAGLLLIPASAPTVGASVNLTSSNQIDLRAQWSVASPSNSIQLQQFRLYSPN